MKGTLEFSLPEEESEFLTAQNGILYKCVLQDLDEDLRAKLKYGEFPDVEHKIYQEIRKQLHDLLEERGVFL